MNITATWDWEKRLKAEKHWPIAGLDEVGRGCWAGPIVAAAFSFAAMPDDLVVADSKVLSATKRGAIQKQLEEYGVWGIGEASAQEIDELGLQHAQYLAYTRALTALPISPVKVLLDGRPWQTDNYDVMAIVDGDAHVMSIAAASIIAKEYRDNLMHTTFHTQFPNYGFDKHVGYGTKVHQEALAKYGVTPAHRTSFGPIRKLLG
jgi:ribonuclease HII